MGESFGESYLDATDSLEEFRQLVNGFPPVVQRKFNRRGYLSFSCEI